MKNNIMKATAVAPSNIAFIKYWGRKNEELRLPENGSVSMNLSSLLTTTTVEFSPSLRHDVIVLSHSGKRSSALQNEAHPESLMAVRDAGQASMTGLETSSYQNNQPEIQRVIKHLDKIRSLAKINYKAKVVSRNNFPTGTGLSSSASGFAALTLAATKSAGLNLSEKKLSILARQGSGSACRSIPDGFVEWLDGDNSETSYSVSIFPPDHWDIVDIVAVVSKNKKEVSTTEGQKLAKSSPFFPVRQERIKEKIKLIRRYLRKKDFKNFGELLEGEALELHTIMLTSSPSLIYWLPGTLKVMHAVKKWRQEGVPVYFTVNTGQDIHLICQKKDAEKVSEKAKKIAEVTKTIINFPDKGARIISKDLF